MHLCCKALFFVIFSRLYLLQDLMYVLSPTNTQAPYVTPEHVTHQIRPFRDGVLYRRFSLYDACCVSAESFVYQ